MNTHTPCFAQLPNVNVALQHHESECCGFQQEPSRSDTVDFIGNGRRQGRRAQGNRCRSFYFGRLRLHDEHQHDPAEAWGWLPGRHLASFLCERLAPKGEKA